MSALADTKTIILLVITAFVLYRLYSVLGTTTGSERPPKDFGKPDTDTKGALSGSAGPDGNNVSPSPAPVDGFQSYDSATEEDTSDALDGPQAEILAPILKAVPDFDSHNFLRGATHAYETVIDSFAQGDIKGLEPLLTKDVLENFVEDITGRSDRDEKLNIRIVSIDKTAIVATDSSDDYYSVSVRFDADLLIYKYDKDEKLIDGSLSDVVSMSEIWVFCRRLDTKDTNWRLLDTGPFVDKAADGDA